MCMYDCVHDYSKKKKNFKQWILEASFAIRLIISWIYIPKMNGIGLQVMVMWARNCDLWFVFEVS